MPDLSPTAQAVLDAYGYEVGGIAAITSYERRGIAAALRAAADQVVPEEQNSDFVPGAPRAYEIQRRVTRHQLLVIAAELEGSSD